MASQQTSAPPRRRNNPQQRNEARTRFRFQQKGAHLTYRGHIGFDIIKAKLMEVSPQCFLWYSFVHESSDAQASYDHTHVAWEWKDRIDKSNPRLFDIGNVHPHIQNFTNQAHKAEIYDDYHNKDPVCIEQSESGPKDSATTLELALRCRTLAEAVDILGIEIKTVSDINQLRHDRARPKPFEHEYLDAEWLLNRTVTRCTYLWGPTGTGKTQWAVHQFTSPLIVSTRDALRDFDPSIHDGIVFDDMDLRDWERTEVIHLFDWDLDRAIKCRYSNALIPKHTRKIVTSNICFPEHFHMDIISDGTGAIRRRFTDIIHVTGPTFTVRELEPLEPAPLHRTSSLDDPSTWQFRDEDEEAFWRPDLNITDLDLDLGPLGFTFTQ